MKYPHRKNFLPAFAVNLLFWILWIATLLFLSPAETFRFSILNLKLSLPLNIFLFFFTLAFSLALTFAFIFANTRRGLLSSLLVIVLLFLKLLKISRWWIILVTLLFLLLIELWFWKKGLKEKGQRKISR